MPVCLKLLKFAQLDRDFVVAGDEEGSLEVTAVVGHQLLRDVGAGVGDLHGGARQHAVLVAHRSRDRSAGFLGAGRNGREPDISSIQVIQTHFRIRTAPSSWPEVTRVRLSTRRSESTVYRLAGGIVVSVLSGVNTYGPEVTQPT